MHKRAFVAHLHTLTRKGKTMKHFQLPVGVIAAIPTPFDDNGSVNFAAFRDFAEFLLANGCDGLNVMGTTGEATSLSTEEREAFMQFISTSGLPLDRLIVGTGASAVPDAISLTREAGNLGFAGALLLPPFYYKNVSAEGVLSYIDQIVEATADSQIPISLYNFPAMSAVRYGVATLRTLHGKFGDRIAGLKDSSNDLDYCQAAAAISQDFKVFPSDEAALITGKTAGFAGCISATASLNSYLCAEALRNGDTTPLSAAVAIRKVFDGLPLVAAVKHSVSLLTEDAGWRRMRAPLMQLREDQQSILETRLGETSFRTASEN